MRDVVTGAFSYTGRHIAERLRAGGRSVTTLTRSVPDRPPLDAEPAPFSFDRPELLTETLRGADTLYNTYWIRFPRGDSTFRKAVENTRVLFGAARRAGVRRIIHVSVTNPSPDSRYAYFRGKAEVEEALRDCGVDFAIVRPTLVFGSQDILVNNIAWILRRLPFFLLPGNGDYRIQPVSVEDVARICVEAAQAPAGLVADAAGPETLSFAGIVELIRAAVGSRSRLLAAPPGLALALTRVAGLALRDVVLTRAELEGLMDSLLVSPDAPRGSDRFTRWVAQNGDSLGRNYVSELARNWR